MIETKKLSDLTLKRITKSDNTFEDVHITDVPSNIISNGTNITDNTLDNINYKDNQLLEFNKLINNNIPTPESGKCLIYSTTDGKLYCAISGYNPFEISQVTASDIIKKKGVTYVNNGSLDYFNLNNGMRLFSNFTKIGAIPTRATETNNILDATYFDITNDEIKALLCGNEKIKIVDNNIRIINNSNTEFKMDSNNKITLNSGTNKLEISSNGFNLSTTSTKVGIISSSNLFECYTNLYNAYYGNNKYRIQIGDNLVIKNNLNNTNLVSINQNGDIDACNDKYRIQMGSNIIIKNNQNNNTIIKINQNGEIYLGDKSLEDYIKGLASREVRRHKEMHQIFSGSSTSYDGYFLTTMNYVFYFSDNPSSTVIMSIEINGQDIEDMINNKIYIPKTNSYYYLEQYEASGVDGDDIDTLYIYKCNNGIHTPAYFRQIYEEY